MNELSIFTLKALRKLYTKTFGGYQLPPLQREEDPDKASDMIYNLLMQDKPCMIARFGAFELATLVNYLGVQNKKHSIWKFIKNEQPEWWWNKELMNYMQSNAGFFPATPENLQRFGKLMIEDMKEIDLLGSWIKNEYYIQKETKNASKIAILCLEPFWSKQPWSRILKEEKVLVIHPFAETIRLQYNKREKLFSSPEILPQFELHIIKAVQSLGGNDQFKDWFEALEWMKNEMDKIDYNICLIGCGAYGFHLAAHAKRKGKKAIHLGGALQLLFGIKGKRWEDPNYGIKSLKRKGAYLDLMNEYWCYPLNKETPSSAKNVENSCYWNK